MSLISRLRTRSVPGLILVACVLALGALTLICYSVLVPKPLPVIVAMSAGHAIGASAFVCYVLAVILDAGQRPPPPTEALATETEDRIRHAPETKSRPRS